MNITRVSSESLHLCAHVMQNLSRAWSLLVMPIIPLCALHIRLIHSVGWSADTWLKRPFVHFTPVSIQKFSKYLRCCSLEVFHFCPNVLSTKPHMLAYVLLDLDSRPSRLTLVSLNLMYTHRILLTLLQAQRFPCVVLMFYNVLYSCNKISRQ